jgi:hypothetical protein
MKVLTIIALAVGVYGTIPPRGTTLTNGAAAVDVGLATVSLSIRAA